MLGCIKGSYRKMKGKKGEKWRIFSLRELYLATNNFNYDNKLGEGGFGSVYWGQLWDGSQIAVKRLKSWSDKAETNFSVEIEILARVRHKNLLTLRGYCVQGQERLIVSDYMTNLSLQSHLHGHYSAECHLDWTRRMSVAIGAAEGIAYLHSTPNIIHGDIKANNVLLDNDFKAQVDDFGFTKLLADDEVSGTASESCDVYSFGVLLLELISGKKLNSTSRAFTGWALPLACERKFDELADQRMNGDYVEDELKRVVFVGLICGDKWADRRPTMLQVVELLKGGNKQKVAALENHEMFMKSDSVAECGPWDGSKIIVEEKES